MKNLALSFFVILTISACRQSNSTTGAVTTDIAGKTVSVKDAPVIKFEKELYDFGVITEGEKVHYDFKFKNTGKTPLIITDASATCGCTKPEYPTKPVKPGEEGVIKVVFNSLGKAGIQDKVVTLTSNANPTSTNVHIVGEVREKKR
ncbi:MAG: DUF1573 domain-containing protein [Bacteroidota bacterium]